MKQQNVFHKVTLESLKKNKTRTLVTIIGIILSTAMICAVASLVSSFQDYLLDNLVWKYGSWHVRMEDSTIDDLEKLENNKHCDSIVYGQTLGYADINSTNTYKPYLYVLGVSDGFTDMTSVHVTKGRLPQNENEIMLPDHLEKNGGVKYDINDTLNLKLGHRMHDGYEFFQTAPFRTAEEHENKKPETIENTYEKTFTVVGFYERPNFEGYEAPGYTALTISEHKPSKSSHLSLFATATHPFYVKNIKELLGNKAVLNQRVLELQGFGFGDDRRMQNILFFLAAIILSLIIFATVSLIYNAFSISVSERTKQFGLLSSLGATKKQLRKSVYFEAFVLSSIGIPIGIFAGLAGIGITLHFIGNRFTDFMSVGYPGSMHLSVSPIYIIGAALLALLTVLLSARRPAKRATKVSAMDAIRQTEDIKDKKLLKKGKIKTSNLVYKLFGFSGMLADKNYKRSRKKYRVTVLSLSMSIILFISAFSFTNYLMASVKDEIDATNCDIEAHFYEKFDNDNTPSFPKDEMLQTYKSLEHVDKVACTVYSEGLYDHHPSIVFVDDDAFKNLIAENFLSINEYTDKSNPKALVYESMKRPNKNASDTTNTGYYIKDYSLENGKIILNFPKEIKGYFFDSENYEGTEYQYIPKAGNEEPLKLPKKENQYSIKVKLGSRLKSKPYFTPYSTSEDVLFFPMSMKETIMPNEASFSYPATHYSFLAKDNKAAEKEIYKANSEFSHNQNEEYGIGFTCGTSNNAENLESMRNLILLIQVFCYGFVTLLSLVSATNVFNTIFTNIRLRRREFAMLQSVGMTKKEMHRMMTYECLQYGLKSLLIGIPISILITLIIHLGVSNELNIPFLFPWVPLIISIFSIFALVFATMLYSMRKISKQNTIETLKDENQ